MIDGGGERKDVERDNRRRREVAVFSGGLSDKRDNKSRAKTLRLRNNTHAEPRCWDPVGFFFDFRFSQVSQLLFLGRAGDRLGGKGE